jgi:hypothetical protein
MVSFLQAPFRQDAESQRHSQRTICSLVIQLEFTRFSLELVAERGNE